jgi:hypothetical protein
MQIPDGLLLLASLKGDVLHPRFYLVGHLGLFYFANGLKMTQSTITLNWTTNAKRTHR